MFVQCFVFSIPALLCSLQHLSQLREDVSRTENQKDGECEMKRETGWKAVSRIGGTCIMETGGWKQPWD